MWFQSPGWETASNEDSERRSATSKRPVFELLPTPLCLTLVFFFFYQKKVQVSLLTDSTTKRFIFCFLLSRFAPAHPDAHLIICNISIVVRVCHTKPNGGNHAPQSRCFVTPSCAPTCIFNFLSQFYFYINIYIDFVRLLKWKWSFFPPLEVGIFPTRRVGTLKFKLMGLTLVFAPKCLGKYRFGLLGRCSSRVERASHSFSFNVDFIFCVQKWFHFHFRSIAAWMYYTFFVKFLLLFPPFPVPPAIR